MTYRLTEATKATALRSIELFAGCGGLALGLHRAGWNGLFAVERDPMAFDTLAANLVEEGAPYRAFEAWPEWMPENALLCALVVFAGVSVWQFLIGNFVAPRMQANSLNLSPLVVLLSLAVWGALWGPVGMFLSAPLTVLVMIVLAQVRGARWIAVLMSADGKPGDYPTVDEDPAAEALVTPR